MKVFLWDDIEKVSNNYHEDGSVLIRAETLERAREIAIFKGYSNDLHPIVGVDIEPDAIFESGENEEKVWIFPNAGCC